MRSFGPLVTSLTVLSFYALTTTSSPFQRGQHPSWTGPGSHSVPAAPPPAPQATSAATSAIPPAATSTTTSSSSDLSDDEKSTSSSTSSSSSNSDTSSPGTGTPGSALIVNKCSFPTYLYVCKQHPASCGSTTTLAAKTGTYSEAYAPASDGGHSLKISVQENSANILQFEYTNEGNGEVSYDLSEVNGNPFGQWGFTLTNTTTDARCAPPATSCPAIFTQPTNGIPYTCSTEDGIGAILCG